MRLIDSVRRLCNPCTRPAFAAVLYGCLMAGEAFGVQDARLTGEDKGILQWLIAFGVVVLMAAIAFLNPKRSHLD